MLYDPRKEIGAREHILTWLAFQPAEKLFWWGEAHNCACGQYARLYLGDATRWAFRDPDGSPLYQLNEIAYRLSRQTGRSTFGQLYRAAKQEWK